MNVYSRRCWAIALWFVTSICLAGNDPDLSADSPQVFLYEKHMATCLDLTGKYEAWSVSSETSNYSSKHFESGLAGMFLAGRIAEGRWKLREDKRPLLQRFDYVHLQQNSDRSITITVGYADEDRPRGSKEISLNDDKRKCNGSVIETFTRKKGGGEGFSSTIYINTVIRKDDDGSIVATETWTESKTVAFIPIGSEKQTFTYRFKLLKESTPAP